MYRRAVPIPPARPRRARGRRRRRASALAAAGRAARHASLRVRPTETDPDVAQPKMEAINPNAELLESRACKVLFTVIREATTTQRDVSRAMHRRPARQPLASEMRKRVLHECAGLDLDLRLSPVALHSMWLRQTG